MRRRFTWRYMVILLLLMFQVSFTHAEVGGGSSPSAADLFQKARGMLAEGNNAEAMELLRVLRVEYPDSPLVPETLWICARTFLEQEEPFRARYYLKKLVNSSQETQLAMDAAFLLGELLYQDKIWNQAGSYFRLGLRLAGRNRQGITPEISRVYLRLAQLAFYHNDDVDLARTYLERINPLILSSEYHAALALLKRNLIWQYIRAEDLGLEDGNISAIAVDGDDLWIGTWSGGLARFSYSTGKIHVFTEGRNTIADNAIRSIEIGERRVWVGTYNGLSVYSKPTSTWRQIEKFGNHEPGTISVIKLIDGIVYVGTLGNGLWKNTNETWSRVGNNETPGRHILCLEEAEKSIYIGTMTKGVFVLDKETSKLYSFDSIREGLVPRNITMLLSDSRDDLWIGTYGEGIVRWSPSDGGLNYYTKDGGEIGDNWVLCGQETPRGLYFGTFGGGVAVFNPVQQSWSHLGLADGLGALDIASLAFSEPLVYCGTLGAGISIYRETLHE